MSDEPSGSGPPPEKAEEETAEEVTSTTVVTRVSPREDSHETPMMSFTAITTHRAMAEAFVRELIKVGQRMMEDRELSLEDLSQICHVALDKREAGIKMLEGRHLRGRVGEQLSRADRYDEPFSLLALRFQEQPDATAYDAVVDTLCERMRNTDLMFLFKSRIILVLPHTPTEACAMLKERISVLLAAAVTPPPEMAMDGLTYPAPDVEKSSQVLDWCEDQLRT
jgi:hypothetical protein